MWLCSADVEGLVSEEREGHLRQRGGCERHVPERRRTRRVPGTPWGSEAVWERETSAWPTALGPGGLRKQHCPARRAELCGADGSVCRAEIRLPGWLGRELRSHAVLSSKVLGGSGALLWQRKEPSSRHQGPEASSARPPTSHGAVGESLSELKRVKLLPELRLFDSRWFCNTAK